MARVKPAYTVTGPGVDVSCAEAGPALSRAVTAACRAASASSFYVRDANGNAVARTDRDDKGGVQVWRLPKGDK